MAGPDTKRALDAPLREFLADRLQDFSRAIKEERDPAVTFSVGAITLEIRLMELPGEFKRHLIPLEAD